jgi:hypothetical protein
VRGECVCREKAYFSFFGLGFKKARFGNDVVAKGTLFRSLGLTPP